MTCDVLCLRPAADFARVGVTPPAGLDVKYRAADDREVPALLAQARALVIPAVGAPLPATLFDATGLVLVQVTGAGLDRLDRDALTRRGIAVANVPGGSNGAVAEYCVTAASALLRRFATGSAEIRAGRYAAFRSRLVADNVGGLEGLQAGIVGMGTIGRAVARAFQAAGCRIAWHDPAVEPAIAATFGDMRALPLDTLLAECDVVSLHVPLLPQTRGLIDARALGLLKRDAVLINAARGGIVDERALAQVLADGKLAGAAVDVYSTEPPPADHPLLVLGGDAAGRLLLTPHIAGVTRQASAYLFREAWANVARVLLAGEAPRYRVY